MKKTSTLVLTLCGSGLLLGCSSMSPRSQVAAPPPMVRGLYDNADAAYFAARQFHRQSRFDEAAVAYQDALTMDASHIETKNGMAALIAGRGDLERAITILTSLAKSHPDAPHILANLGYAHYLKGNITAADQALEQAVRIAPDDEQSWGKLAAVLDQHRLAGPKDAPAAPDIAAVADAVTDADPLRIEIAALSAGEYAVRYLDAGLQPAMPPAMPPASQSAAVAPVMPPNPPAETFSPVPLANAMRLEIANGNGVRGLARSMSKLIKSDTWQVVRILNNDSFKVSLTRIEYADGALPAARLLAEHLGMAAEMRPHDRLSGAALRVVIGHDFRSVNAMRQRQQHSPLACASMTVQS